MVFLSPQIILVKILTIGSQIHEKNRGIQRIVTVLFCYHSLFIGIHAADRRTVAVVTGIYVP